MNCKSILLIVALFSLLFIGCKGEEKPIEETNDSIIDDGIREVELNFNGGTSLELYKEAESVASFTLNNYNTNSGSFWSGQYEKCVFITDRANDPGAQFSDRIYIGRNPYTGYFEVVDTILSGVSSWPTIEKGFDFDAEYVITVSESYSSYYKIHQKMLNIERGQIVLIATSDITTISKETPSNVKFYDKDIDIDKLVYDETNFEGLPTPVRIGFEFLGWFDNSGKEVSEIKEIDCHYVLTAKWEELNPVTDILVNGIETEVVKGYGFKIDFRVEPSDAFFQKVYVTSSNNDVLKVDASGNAEALNCGESLVTITDYMNKVTKTYLIKVYPTDSLDVSFSKDFNGSLKVGESTEVYGKFYGKDEDSYKIEYSSSDENVIEIVYGNDKVELLAKGEGVSIITVKATSNNNSFSLNYNISVSDKTNSDKLDEVLALLQKYNFSRVQTINFSLFDDSEMKYYKSTYGSVNYYLFTEFLVDRTYEAQAEANTNCRKSRRSVDTIEFVTVHDTATLIGTVEGTADYLSSGVTSIHYTVGDYKTLSVVPEKYIAYHAGDGTSMSFRWQATGVMAKDSNAPTITVEKVDGKWFFAINGEVTKVTPSLSNGEKTITDPKNALTSLGPTWTIKDGEYYIGTTHACFSSVISGVIGAYGGNANSIGIEMNVNSSGDMFDTLQRTAKLVADILVRNNLDLTRVKQHNTWTGKNCPQVLLTGNYWSEFMKMVEIEYILMKDYSDVLISFKSNNPNIIDVTGRVINPPKTSVTVSYDVTVALGEASKTITLYTIIPGTATWEEWNGLYETSKTPINGNYIN